MAVIHILYSSGEGQTAKIARRIGGILQARGHRAHVAPLDEYPQLVAADGYIIGSSIHMGRYPEILKQLVDENRRQLESVPNAFFSVSLSAASADAQNRANAPMYIQTLLDETGWKPLLTGNFAGALRYTVYGFVKRQIMKRIFGKQENATDTSHDYEYTDWAAVEEFADRFARRVEVVPA